MLIQVKQHIQQYQLRPSTERTAIIRVHNAFRLVDDHMIFFGEKKLVNNPLFIVPGMYFPVL